MSLSLDAFGQDATQATVWFGTGGNTKGIYRSELNLETGELSSAELAAEIQGPGFLTVNSSGNRLYSIGQVSGTTDNVAVYEIGPDHRQLRLLDTADSGGGKPTHIALSRDERTLLLAHYGGGSSVSMRLEDDGRIGEVASRIDHTGSSVNAERQDRPHPHWIGATPDNRYVLVPDLGTDQVVIYRFDPARHTLTPHGAGIVPPGSGPRHLKFHPNGKWAYVLNEMGLTVTGFSYDADQGTLNDLQTAIALPEDELKDVLTTGSEIRMHPSGRFVYAGIRGHDVVAVFRIDPRSGRLTLVEREPIRGSWPRTFGLDPTGHWLIAAGAESSTATVFRVDQETGRLTFTRNLIHVPSPICVEFQPRR